MVYDGSPEMEAKRQFNLFVIQSKDLRSKSASARIVNELTAYAAMGAH